ncbi:hypothetical protein PRIPAC_92867 [Pristionchus pacificus]|uniref:Uncharacterized protein n=1 Tax=Pristionchus pacificus TaxID=54126 RepID=A0A454XQG1_PRIPA|nr:hypothetical protein PRIPAC_92867 [Pristionchus pacificus]|eukprot:PDM67975.1 hypothetical protein PRIPAC_46019 [Pristionchus pacificus]
MLVFLLFVLSSSLASPTNLTELYHVPEWEKDVVAGDTFVELINGVNRTCNWVGTAPVCSGECPNTHDEIERRRDRTIPKSWCCRRDPYFGWPCYFGSKKAKCCLKI